MVRTAGLPGVTGVTRPVGARSVARVLLPELVPTARAVVLPVAGYVSGDLAELVATSTGTTGVSARAASTGRGSGFDVLYRAGWRLHAAPQRAFELYRSIHVVHDADFDSFDTAVMVLDLDQLRRDGFADRSLGAMELYALNDREAFHLVAGEGRGELKARWAHVPSRDVPEDPAIWAWAAGREPWSTGHTLGQSLWADA
ncbi:hypothetical protein GCM10025865_21640 [Paraoerskovia sediminicola]|uniref:Uncharacterized protein n=1 Tax=Paraoerskovia sediminicola TaxID=1138587 RepID=A0ABM8G4B3_9CELL|nr:hypothetical protein [Paraoerskovia sediminicola]BDZ42865.1 hypothetical protein GCM10025865_21640 [Paraoerskovia sediminicola]